MTRKRKNEGFQIDARDYPNIMRAMDLLRIEGDDPVVLEAPEGKREVERGGYVHLAYIAGFEEELVKRTSREFVDALMGKG